ncbi:MAG: TonB-dependent receptor, partial [Rhizorhabdus sp.]|nr:TonB-dependent receptor [Rhizorhabdus sp.]
MLNRTTRHRLLAAAALTVPHLAMAQTPPAAAEAADSSEGNGEIVVTARRREEKLIDVPISVTAISGDALGKQGAVDITALQDKTPNLTLQIARGSNSTLIA